MSVADHVLRFFEDEQLTRESTTNSQGSTQINYSDELVLLPGETASRTIYVKFVPFKESHIYRIDSIEAKGDVRVVASQKRTLKAGESQSIEVEWIGRVMDAKTLEPLSGSIQVHGALIAPVR